MCSYKEIERKFLFKGDLKEVIKNAGGTDIEDYYFNKYTRLRFVNNLCYIGVKSDGTLCRDEFEYPLKNVDRSAGNFRPLLCKTRYYVTYKEHLFQINVFKTLPVITVEVELENEDEEVLLPDWCGEEITNNKDYYGYNLWGEINGRFNSVSEKSRDTSTV